VTAQLPNDNEQLSILDYIKHKVKKNREETIDIVNTLFLSGMEQQPPLFLIVEEYCVGSRPIKCDLAATGEDIETIFSDLYRQVMTRHSDMYKITELFETDLKLNDENPITYLKGYLVQNKSEIIPFSAFSPRRKTDFVWAKRNLFSKVQVETTLVKQANELETGEYYYQFSISQDEIPGKQLDDIKLHIVKSLYREMSFSDEVYLLRKMEVTWRKFEEVNAISADDFENFLKELYTFKEAASPEVRPSLEELYDGIYTRKSLMNQYELIRKHKETRPIWIK
jgi:hypothetical protein